MRTRTLYATFTNDPVVVDGHATVSGPQAAQLFAELEVKSCQSLADGVQWMFPGGIVLTLVTGDGVQLTEATWRLGLTTHSLLPLGRG